jgi:hypothetical protein
VARNGHCVKAAAALDDFRTLEMVPYARLAEAALRGDLT